MTNSTNDLEDQEEADSFQRFLHSREKCYGDPICPICWWNNIPEDERPKELLFNRSRRK